MANGVSDRYTTGLLRTVQEPSLALEALKRSWPDVEREFGEKRRCLERRIRDEAEDDPILRPVDLLAPLNRIDAETLHTRALAYLLDPSQSHGLGDSALREVVQTTRQAHRSSEARKILGLLQGKRTRISVTPEYRYCVEEYRERSVARSDIWIELGARKNAALIVVENKIDAPESTGQLGWYERKARDWRGRAGRGALSLLIFLAREKREVKSSDSGEWVALSYLELAAALRRVWLRRRQAVGHAWLGLYIASITHGLLGLDLRESDGATLTEIETYLGEAQ